MNQKTRVAFLVALVIAFGLGYLSNFYFSPETINNTGKNVVNILPTKSFYDAGQAVTAGGVWRAKGESLANEFNATDVFCFNPYGNISLTELASYGEDTSLVTCYIAQADIMMNGLFSDLQIMEVTEWSEDRVVAEASGTCRKTSMVLDRESGQVTQTGVLIKSDGMCEGLSDEPIQSYIGDGSDIIGY
jgi:hypothetical protein